MVDFGFSKRMEVYVNSLENMLMLNLKWTMINYFTEIVT